MPHNTISLGKRGEQIAADFLRSKGYKIITTDYRCCCGQIDIICRIKKTLCFVEVKTRKTKYFGEPEEAVTDFKQKKISQCALLFFKEHKYSYAHAQFDVISIYCPDETPMQVKHIKHAFTLSRDYY